MSFLCWARRALRQGHTFSRMHIYCNLWTCALQAGDFRELHSVWVGATGPQLRHCEWWRDASPDLPAGKMMGVWTVGLSSCQLLQSDLAAESSLAWGILQPVTARQGIKAPTGAPGLVNLRHNVNVNVTLLVSMGWQGQVTHGKNITITAKITTATTIIKVTPNPTPSDKNY